METKHTVGGREVTGATRKRRDWRRDAVATREALMAAAAELFAERGYDGVPVWAIAAKAGVNKAMISYHFGGKRNLYQTIAEDAFGEVVSRIEELADSARPAPDLLKDLVADVAEVTTKRSPHVFTMLLREVLAGGKRLEPGVAGKPVRMLAAVQRIVERGVREGTLRQVDPLLTHLSLVGSLVFFFATERFRRRVLKGRHFTPPDVSAFVRHIQDLITHGLTAHGEESGSRVERHARKPAARGGRGAHGRSDGR